MIHYKWIRFLSMLVVLLFSITALGQNTEDFNPDSPGEPGQPNMPDKPVTPEDTATYYTLTLLAQEGGSVKSGGGQYAAETEVQVVANAASTNFVFTGWTNERGDTIATTLSFLYTMPARNASLLAHYDFVPGSPAEPSQPDIPVTPTEPVDTTVYYSLSLLAEEGGSITAGAGNYAEGTEVTVTASAPATNFVFANWTDSNGDVVSNVRSFSYTMPAHNETLTAHYDFDPGSPSEPSQPDIPEKEPDTEPVPTHLLTITVEEGGTVTVNGAAVNGTSTIELAEGATAAITTTLSTNFTFDGWYIMNATGEELYSDSRSFTFTMDTVDVSLVAKFNFDPDAPSEPSMPTTSNNELYLMSVVGLPGETINYPLYLNSNDTLRDIRFEMQFPLMMVPDFDNVSISPNAVGYTFSYERYNMNEILGAKRRAPGDNEGEISDDYVIYDIQMTGGVTPPGNTALFIVPVTIDEDISEERHRIWLSQVEVMLNDSTVVGATTRNGAINTDYEEPDSYAYLDNIISVGSTAYSTTQAQQISHLEPFTVDVPADSIAYILGCSDVSFVTFKGRESLLKITDEQTAENGFWFGRDGYVRPFVEDADSMRMAVQYNPDTHVMSIMQYPGAYEVGDADTVKVYFTYKYKYYEVELRLSVDRPDTFIELGNELREAKDSLNAIKPRIQQSYEMTGALNVNALVLKCDSLMDDMNYFLPFFENIEDGNEELSNIYNEVSQLISDTYEFIARADSIMPLYEEAFAALQEAKATLVATITELAETATQPAIDAANALVAKVNEEYITYDVAKANEMTDSLRLAETMLRYSVATNIVEVLNELNINLEVEILKIEECYAKTNANDIADLRDECNTLIFATLDLVDLLNASTDSNIAEIFAATTAHKAAVEEFIARADSIMPLYEEAFAALQEAKATLVATVEELAETATQPAIDAANALVAKVNEEYTAYDVDKANEMTDSLRLAETVVRNSVVTNEKAKELALVLSSLQTEKLKIEGCYAKTNANDIATLGNECVELIVTTQSLQDAIDSLIETNDSITAEITEDIIANKTAVEEFIARADSIMPLYEEAFVALQEAKATLVATVEELAETATIPAIDAANALVAKVNEEYTAYDVAKANEMTDSLRLAETVVRNSVVTNEKAKELALVISSLLTEKLKIEECYDKTNANDIAALRDECDKLIVTTQSLQAVVDSLIETNDSITAEITADIIANKTAVEEFIARADSIMPLYEEAFAALQEAKATLVATVEELAETATQPAIDAANALVAKVNEEYTAYDVAKANEMTDSLLLAADVVRYSVVTNENAKKLATILNNLQAEKQKIEKCYDKTNANDIADLLAECNSLIYATSELQSDVDALIENNDSITTELIAPITALKVTVEEFIALADSIMPLYEEAFDSLMIALNRLSQTIEELRQSVIKSAIKEAEDLCDSIKQSQPYYSLTDYENAEKDINDMILYLRSLVQSEDVTIEVTESGTTEENIANPESLETLAIVGPVNGTDIRFIREGLPQLRILDLSKAWIVEGGDAYLDELHTTNLTIGDRMFAELPQLESLVLCDSVTTIGVEILSNTKQVTTITIPSKTQTVASGALNDSRKDIKVVWNAVEAVVPAMLNGNPNLMVYAVNGVKGEREWQNIIHDGRIDSITLRDDYPLYIPEEFHTNKVSYARKFTKKTIPNSASGWESIALPFDVRTITHRVSGRTLAPFGAEQECDARFWLGQMTEEGFNAATSMSANIPYLVRMPNSPEYSEEDNVTGVVLFTASDSNGVLMHRTSETVVSVGNGYSLVPTYESIEASENIFALNDDYYEGYLPGSVFVRMQRDVRPMEAYIIAEEGNARLDYITLDMLQPDGIVNVENDAKNSEMVYTLTGIRINRANMKRGNIYIINGKLTKY